MQSPLHQSKSVVIAIFEIFEIGSNIRSRISITDFVRFVSTFVVINALFLIRVFKQIMSISITVIIERCKTLNLPDYHKLNDYNVNPLGLQAIGVGKYALSMIEYGSKGLEIINGKGYDMYKLFSQRGILYIKSYASPEYVEQIYNTTCVIRDNFVPNSMIRSKIGRFIHLELMNAFELLRSQPLESQLLYQ